MNREMTIAVPSSSDALGCFSSICIKLMRVLCNGVLVRVPPCQEVSIFLAIATMPRSCRFMFHVEIQAWQIFRKAAQTALS